MSHDDSLADFSARCFDHEGESRRVYAAGSGPAVVLMPEMPGIEWVPDPVIHNPSIGAWKFPIPSAGRNGPRRVMIGSTW